MSKGLCREFMDLGHAALKAGRPGEALEHYRQALVQEPESAEANSVYGLMLLHMDRAAEAGPPLQRAVEIAPSHAAFRMNLAEWLKHQGMLDQAAQLVEGVAADQPQFWWAWDRLGDLKVRLKRFDDAASHFALAAGLKPNDPSPLFKWARSSFDAGCADEAERILGEAARLAPTHEAILRLYADLFESQARWLDLERVARAWTGAHPKSAQAWRWLAKAQWETGYLRQAMQNFRTSFDVGARDADGLATFGRLCLQALDLESARAALDEAETLDPDYSPMLTAKAVLLMWFGRYDEAEAYCRHALRNNRDDVSAYKTLSQLTGGRLPDEDMAVLRELTDRSDIRLQDRITAAFALAEGLDERDEIDEAFAAYQTANRLAYERAQLEDIRYDPAEGTRQTDELVKIFSAVPQLPTPQSERKPIFILGMPRSGTTLVESVISAHSGVVAGGERMAIRWVLREFLAHARGGPVSAIPDSTWTHWRDYYWQEFPEAQGATAATDKNPWNFDALGLILQLFPDARIIHVRRNPVETGFSIFRNEFSKLVRFTHRLEDIGHYYSQYARVMAHWEHVAGDRFMTIQYEEFIREFDVAGPALLAACGLDWEEACGNFWESNRTICTMSTMQVRRPLGKASGRAKSYSAHLQPLVESLQAAGVDLVTGALMPVQDRVAAASAQR